MSSVQVGLGQPTKITELSSVIFYAAVAHLVERHLAKVEVASSSLVGRSKQNRLKRKFQPVFVFIHKSTAFSAPAVRYNQENCYAYHPSHQRWLGLHPPQGRAPGLLKLKSKPICGRCRHWPPITTREILRYFSTFSVLLLTMAFDTAIIIKSSDKAEYCPIAQLVRAPDC